MGVSANANINIRGDLNNNAGLLSNVCGIAAVGSLGYGSYRYFSGKSGIKVLFGGLFTGGVFATASYVLRKDDKKEREKERQHEREMARIKHPSFSRSTTEVTEVSPNVPSCFLPAQKHESTNAKPVEFLVSKEIRKGGYTLIAAPKGQGKSILARQIGHAIATGNPCEAFPDDTPHSPQRVIYLDAELTCEDNDSRGYKTVQGMDVYTKEDFNYTSLNDVQDDISRLVEDVGADCTVILDCITSYKFGMSLVNIGQMKTFNAVLDNIRSKALEKGCVVTFIAVTHISESAKNPMEGMRGCLEAYQNATTIMFITPDDKFSDDKSKKVIHVETNRQAQERNWLVDMVDKSEVSPVLFTYRDNTEMSESVSTKPQWQGKLSLEKTRQMKDFYQPGIKGHGYKPAAEEFGLNHATEAQRELQKLEIYEAKLVAYEADDGQKDER